MCTDPTICTVCFGAFICKPLGPDASVLELSDLVLCSDSSHRGMQIASIIMIVCFAIGVPLKLGISMSKSATAYRNEHAAANELKAKELAEDLSVPFSKAAFVVRDLTIGRGLGFLMDAYKPEYLYCGSLRPLAPSLFSTVAMFNRATLVWFTGETLDMFRKVSLVGIILLVGRGSIAQLSTALLISYAIQSLVVAFAC
jgi:hypothetical protein